jgi:lipid A ethanolaminephosphotransferase
MAPLRRIYARYPVVLVAVYLALAGNLAFWAQLQDVINGSTLHRIGFLVSFFFLIVAFTVFLLQAFQFKYLTKPVLITILIASAFTSYFMLNYGVVIDTTMIHNVLETDTRESTDLLTIRMLVYVLLLGVIPALLVYKAPVSYLSPLRQLGKNAIIIVLSFGLIAGNFLLSSSEYTSFFRNHHHMRYLINPVNYIYSVGKVTAVALENHDTSPIPIGIDAKHTLATADQNKNSLIVVVVGETARARNFPLNGYNRNTTPELQHENVINYPNYYSCGTSTHVSLPCMFSMFGRDKYDEAMAQRYEKLPDVLQRAGLNVLWLDNNSGCKGVCKNVPTEVTSHRKLKGLCTEDGCFDDVMLVDLDKYIEGQNKDTVIILHQNGSHGPAYYRRYPDQFSKFSPACNTNDLGSCGAKEIINAYDNTILYTDHFLEEVITLLKKESGKFDTAMLYVSDHGESLGEHNVYLHSLPYMIAPDEQKHVPFIAWFSDGFIQDNQFSQSCFKQRANLQYSHDYLFHTLLGLTHVSTSIYNPELDMFRPCNTHIARTPQQSPAS